MPNIPEAISKFSGSFQNLPRNRKITLILVLSLIIIGGIVLFHWLNQPNFQLLYSGLSPENAGEIVTKLKQEKIPYQLKNGATSILVPEEKVYELRLQLASDKVLQKGIVGFELFDQNNLGTTEFVQTINYHRALEGELSRTINSLSEIEWARVHLALPQKSLFVEEEQAPTASVVVKLRSGARLRKDQINGIVHLLSCSVEGLPLENIRVIDDQGRILSDNPNDYADQLTQIAKMEYQSRIEENMEKKITSMLEKALGENKVTTRVSVVLNQKKVESTEEKYDPDRTVVKTEQRIEESAQGQPPSTPGGTGSETVPGAIPGGDGSNSNYQKSDETIKYELTKATNHIIEMPGQITRLSVAVVVDGSYEKKDQDTKYIPRTPEEMKSIRTIVEKATGYDVTRGDQIEVVNIPFHEGRPDRSKEGGFSLLQNRQLWLSIAKYGAKVLIALLILLFIFRPLLKWLYSFSPLPPVEEVKTLPLEEREVPMALEDGQEAMINELQQNLPERLDKLEVSFKTTNSEESKMLEELVEVIRELAKQEPKRIAQLTKEWLQEERKQS